jgi:AcrR family transcriptional regulator
LSSVSTAPGTEETAPRTSSAPEPSASEASAPAAPVSEAPASVPPVSEATAPEPSASEASAPARRGAEATKTAILKAARYLLARHAHADITLKAVAARAGVSPPLIVKYFGNKDALFARVMSFDTDADALLDAPLAGLGRHMVRYVLSSQRGRGADPLLRIAFAPLHGDHGDILRANFRAQVTERLADRLTGSDAGLRAELAVAALVGLGVMYGIARGPHLREKDIDVIADRYGPLVQAQLTPAG